MAAPNLMAIHHIALNVRNLERSVQWYGEVLGFAPLFPYDTPEFKRRLIRHPGGVTLALTKHDHPDAEAQFSERRTGLDHLSFEVSNETELKSWADHLDALEIPHSDILVIPAIRSSLIAFRDPDNIQLELYTVQSGARSS